MVIPVAQWYTVPYVQIIRLLRRDGVTSQQRGLEPRTKVFGSRNLVDTRGGGWTRLEKNKTMKIPRSPRKRTPRKWEVNKGTQRQTEVKDGPAEKG